MAILRMKEIREMDSDRRFQRMTELKAELMRLRTTGRSGGSLEDPSRVRQIRRTIARVLTVENEERRVGKK